MAIGLMEERPPFVQFELREEEDRTQSIECGRYMAKSVAYALIMPAGTRDTVERVAEDWLADIAAKSRQQPPAFPPDWARGFAEMYRLWKEGEAMPQTGTPIKTWPVISPAQAKNLISARVYTVEDLAAANEDTLRMAGMGARELKSKAQTWLEEARGAGAAVAKVAAQQVQIETLQQQLQESQAAIAELNARLAALAPEPKRRGRPPVEDRDVVR